MNCSHCLGACAEDGADMTDLVLTSAIKFLKKIKPLVVLVSGGEPTLHPDVLYILKRLKLELPKSYFCLISNGTFYQDDNLLQEIMKMDILVQITNDKRFYPNAVDFEKLSKFDITTEIPYPNLFGRAASNNLNFKDTRTSPYCYNMRSLLKKLDFISANRVMEQRNKFCAWSIDPNGNILLSESLLCPSVGNVIIPLEATEENIRNFKCVNCKYAQNLIRSNTALADILR